MNRWKGNAVTQITLDEDFIVPDTLEDMEQVILEQAHIQGENVKTQEEKITVKGKLEFQVLYLIRYLSRSESLYQMKGFVGVCLICF